MLQGSLVPILGDARALGLRARIKGEDRSLLLLREVTVLGLADPLDLPEALDLLADFPEAGFADVVGERLEPGPIADQGPVERSALVIDMDHVAPLAATVEPAALKKYSMAMMAFCFNLRKEVLGGRWKPNRIDVPALNRRRQFVIQMLRIYCLDHYGVSQIQKFAIVLFR